MIRFNKVIRDTVRYYKCMLLYVNDDYAECIISVSNLRRKYIAFTEVILTSLFICNSINMNVLQPHI